MDWMIFWMTLAIASIILLLMFGLDSIRYRVLLEKRDSQIQHLAEAAAEAEQQCAFYRRELHKIAEQEDTLFDCQWQARLALRTVDEINLRRKTWEKTSEESK